MRAMSDPIRLPAGRRFAFTILDDTDDSTLENVRPVYERLREYGFRTTKTVWPLDCPQGSRLFFAADTLQRREYLEYVRELVEAGFELASHGATMESSTREETLRAIRFLEQEFGVCPRLHANHAHNQENLYWGHHRFRTRLLRWLLSARRARTYSTGHDEGSPYFWGDVCREKFHYVRNFTFSELNMLRVNPEMPYRLASTPWVRAWFSTTDAPDVHAFRERVNRPALERLEEEGGVCIVSTHLGKGFAPDGRLLDEIDGVLRYLAERPGWFVPVSELLDHLAGLQGVRSLDGAAIRRLELRYLSGRLRDRVRATA